MCEAHVHATLQCLQARACDQATHVFGAMEPPSKAARLNDLRARIPYMSQSALAGILREAMRQPLPEISSRTSIRSFEVQGLNVNTPYGPLIKEIAVTDSLKVAVALPAPMLFHCATESPSVKSLLQRTLSQHDPTPTDPWGAVVYLDEIIPGNVLAHKNYWKTWWVYWSVLQWAAQCWLMRIMHVQ